jgi:hypothetical protein
MVQIADDVVIPVPSLPSLTALKLFAWRDRRDRTTKDALDFTHLLCVYGEAGNKEKLYGPAFDLLEKAGYDIQLAGARLLGAEVRTTMLPETTTALIDLFSDPALIDRMTLQMAPHFRSSNDKIQAAERLLSQFTTGLSGAWRRPVNNKLGATRKRGAKKTKNENPNKLVKAGYSTSEDALTWTMFRFLESKNRLREAFAGNAAHRLYVNQPAVSSNKKSYFM